MNVSQKERGRRADRHLLFIEVMTSYSVNRKCRVSLTTHRTVPSRRQELLMYTLPFNFETEKTVKLVHTAQLLWI